MVSRKIESPKDLTDVELDAMSAIVARFVKGRKEYGEGTPYATLSPIQWLDNAIEEAADQLQYLCAAKRKLQEVLDEAMSSSK